MNIELIRWLVQYETNWAIKNGVQFTPIHAHWFNPELGGI